ncbi:SDR family NAD(P)-dependent oxidoreductase [Tellurirhabdus rosea]|uniref:SDR family NAD(P)-dependent oxidoreductase n=1 Tax=Tellurirhabdus rosea TaxID=2674997 RepID=UPI002255BE86|nr:SDR family NAD(P)-dependent oxidoreductase [Tellurirhabdus rosea]
MPTILLTGGNGGLGRTVTQTLIRNGHTLFATHEAGHALPQAANLTPIEADLRDEAACQRAVAQSVAAGGTLDAAVLLAGGFAMGSLAETDYAAVEKMFQINFQTAYNLVRPVVAQMEKQPEGGRIVLIGARPALAPEAGQHMVAYALSKSLVMHLSELINAAGKAKNIVSTVILPSTIDTPANREAMPDANPESWVSPADLAELIQFVTFGPGRMLREPVLKAYNRA